MNTKELDKEYVAGTYGRFPLEITEGKGCHAYDESGKEYIDLGSGIAVNIFGFQDEEWIDAVSAQLHKVQHTSNLYYTKPGAELASLLCQKTGMKKVFFGNSGAEANECAVKTARKWAYDQYGDESHANIITLKNSFHGRTITTLAACGQDSLHQSFGPFTPGFLYAEANNYEDFKKIADSNSCCAVMLEMIQGEGGVIPLEKDFAADVVNYCHEHNMLVIVDEIQTGNGRTGKLYSWMNYDFTPDIMTTAKGLGGGLPIGACLFAESTENVLTPGTHGSTFGGNPAACAGAVSILKRIDDTLLSEVNEKSAYIFDQLHDAEGVKDISGMGLMIGISSKRNAKDVVFGCMEKGVLVLTAHDKVRLLPPLNIPMTELQKAIAVLKEELAK